MKEDNQVEVQLEELLEIINSKKDMKGALIPILHEVQTKYDCVPLNIQKIIGNELDISVSKINGVVTFYSQFSIEPKGKTVIGICLGTACYVRGSQEILDSYSAKLGIEVGKTTEDGEYTLEATRCIGACGLAPVVDIGGEIFGNVTKAEADSKLEEYQNESGGK